MFDEETCEAIERNTVAEGEADTAKQHEKHIKEILDTAEKRLKAKNVEIAELNKTQKLCNSSLSFWQGLAVTLFVMMVLAKFRII